MKITNDIINWITQSGAVLWLFYFAFVIAKPFVDGKIKHAKTAQQREAWTLLEQVAMTTVNSLVSADKPGRQKFDEASTQVASYLADHGIKMDMGTIQSAVQAAYEKSPLTTPVSESTESRQLMVFKQRSSRYLPIKSALVKFTRTSLRLPQLLHQHPPQQVIQSWTQLQRHLTVPMM